MLEAHQTCRGSRGREELRLESFGQERNVVIEIGDNGPRIPPEIVRHIFDLLFTTKGLGEGTELGLNTMRTIVRKREGCIHVELKVERYSIPSMAHCRPFDHFELDLRR